MNKLVSIVSPCYNVEKCIERFLNSIISQTYRPLELILINDGSTDKTESIILSYKDRLESDGIELKYISQENKGVGAAVNLGLKYMTGQYLVWPDSDDILYPDSIKKRVEFLEANTEFGYVYSAGDRYIENKEEIAGRVEFKMPKEGRLFNNIVTDTNIVYNPCGYMLRMSAFLDVNGNKEIFPSRYGQNIQMLAPISFKYKCGYIDESLYARIDTENSLSKRVWTESSDAWKNRIMGLNQIKIETLKSIGGTALAYIPYVQYRGLRELNSVSKNISREERKKHKAILKKAFFLMIKEMLKFVNDIR